VVLRKTGLFSNIILLSVKQLNPSFTCTRLPRPEINMNSCALIHRAELAQACSLKPGLLFKGSFTPDYAARRNDRICDGSYPSPIIKIIIIYDEGNGRSGSWRFSGSERNPPPPLQGKNKSKRSFNGEVFHFHADFICEDYPPKIICPARYLALVKFSFLLEHDCSLPSPD